jgi:hypothetical protein
MSEIASLIREFPFGSFLIITGIIGGITSVCRAYINRDKPVCNCECCNNDLDDDVGEEVETEVEDEDDDCEHEHKENK